jgi:GTP pyrophosphokinase
MKMADLSPSPASGVSSVGAAVSALVAATADSLPVQADALRRARAFALPFIDGETLATGEPTLAHADAVVDILQIIGGSKAMQAAIYLVHACDHLTRPGELIAKAFGDEYAALAVETHRLSHVQRQARGAPSDAHLVEDPGLRTEHIRKMLLAFSRDLRVVLLRLASRLETLRYCAAQKVPVAAGLAQESLQVFAPLADRLGVWQVKWEMEDLAFRFLEPETYRDVARMLDEKRAGREIAMEELRSSVEAGLCAEAISARVQGRPKHIYSIVRKMRGKSLDFDRVFDLRALRVIVTSIEDCYAALSWSHTRFEPIDQEFDDYIARPKPNGYQSLHTVVRDAEGRAVEIQIRTQAMHDHAEHGVAAHWAYKEAGARGYSGTVTADSAYETKIAVLRQLLAWERDVSGAARVGASGLFEDRIYVLTPEAAVVELPAGATPVDFAYSVHTEVGHRCRGARVDGAMVPLNTPLQNGQTVEISVAKEGTPSRDWLNAELGYLASHRARAKVRAWFNTQASSETTSRGRDIVERLLQREGRTAVKLEEMASQLGFRSADALFEQVGKDDYSLRHIEVWLRPVRDRATEAEIPAVRKPRNPDAAGDGILVVGVDSLMTQLARCCRPAPPDAVGGFVTMGKGVSVHRSDCTNFREMALRNPGRVIDVQWDSSAVDPNHAYPVDVLIEANDRQGLLRDISEVFAKEGTNVVGVQTHTRKGLARMTFTVEVSGSARLAKVLSSVSGVNGIHTAKRR